ncbi:Predicted arabinose efflux permease, MFS family [Terribacillus halophilus]|uniref:Predicted arabinose efflux permease, MFS family n=1 Tax=Terribacillus halophilus TaxID=361279 RepID=A0A1G6I633_9BACI|nr:MFS transporter [Terribacillus halophilus]SDC01910.1 Predicted arabinose efflux permease, MFS family [Terribacillus halophilus]
MVNNTPPLWTKAFVFLLLGNLFTFMSFQMLLPNLPPYIASIGGSSLQVGLVTTSFSIAAILIRPFIGHILLTKKRKMPILIGSFLLLVCTILYPFTQIVTLLLIFRFLHGAAWGWSTTTNGTAAVDLVPRRRVGEGMGYFGLSITIGMIIAPSIGIFLYQNYNFKTLVFVSILLGIIAFLFLSLTRYAEPEALSRNQAKPPKFSFFQSLIEKKSSYPVFITFLTSFGYGSIVTYLVLFGEEQHLTGTFLFYLANALCATISRPFTGRLFDAKGPWLLIMGCSLIAFLAMWILSIASANWYFIISGALFGIGYGSMIPALQAWTISKTDVERSGIANGMYYSSIDFGIGLSAVILGILHQFVSTSSLFQMSSFLFLLVFLFTLTDFVIKRRKDRHPVANVKNL